MDTPRFVKRVIGELSNAVDASPMNTLCIMGDINADGRPDIVVSGRNGTMAWFQNPGGDGPWRRHVIGEVANMECGGLVADLTGSGYPDIINGGDYRSDELSWWENPGPAGGHWTRRVIAKTGKTQFHDELIADLRGDGRPSLLFWNQGARALYTVPLPADPRVSPWPGVRCIAEGCQEGGLPEEGLAVADVDGDGRAEIIAGTRWYKEVAPDRWEGYQFAREYITTKVAVGDVDGDGRNEIVLSEGDACIYGKPQGGKLAYFKPGSDMRVLWAEHRLDDLLLDPHTLHVADLCGQGRLDVLVGEIGSSRGNAPLRLPRILLYENHGSGRFTRHEIDRGTGTHNAWLVDLRGRGVLDLVGRPLHGEEKWQIHVYERRP